YPRHRRQYQARSAAARDRTARDRRAVGVQGALPYRHAQRGGLLQGRRHPALRVAPDAGAAVEQGSGGLFAEEAARLPGPQLGIEAATADQFGVAAVLDGAALVQEDEP